MANAEFHVKYQLDSAAVTDEEVCWLLDFRTFAVSAVSSRFSGRRRG
jgi:hypothetical protein